MRRRVHFIRYLAALGLSFACWLELPSSAAAQSSRAEVIAQEQQAKAAHLGREGPSNLENVVIWVERSPLISGTSGFYPWVESVYHGTGLGAGAGYLRRMTGGSHVNVLTAMSTNGSSLLKAHARMPEIASGLVKVELDARYTIAEDLSFYGLGPNSAIEDAVRYDYRPVEIGATAALLPARWIELSGGYRWMPLWTDKHVSGWTAVARGLGQELAYHVVSASVALDWRTAPGYSTRGGSHRLTWSQYTEAQDRPFSFHELEYEAIQLVPFLREQFVFALRGLVTVTKADDPGGVPFVLEPTLGGAETLRGFETRRFTDLSRLLFNGEYRWRPSRHIDFAIFFDAGKVAEHGDDLGLSNLETDWGIGTRFHGPAFVFLRAEAARSHEGWHFVFSGEKSF